MGKLYRRTTLYFSKSITTELEEENNVEIVIIYKIFFKLTRS